MVNIAGWVAARDKERSGINIQVHAGITHDGQVARRGQPHFAVDLVLAAVGGVTARPDIDVAYSRTGPLLYTLGAKILKPNVLVQIRGEDDFALRELARGRREGQRIVERADTPGCEATTTIIGDCRTRGIIVGESIELDMAVIIRRSLIIGVSLYGCSIPLNLRHCDQPIWCANLYIRRRYGAMVIVSDCHSSMTSSPSIVETFRVLRTHE